MTLSRFTAGLHAGGRDDKEALTDSLLESIAGCRCWRTRGRARQDGVGEDGTERDLDS